MKKIFFFLFVAIVLAGIGNDTLEKIHKTAKVSVFNWEKDMVTVENADTFFNILSENNICAVYQYISSKTAKEDIVYYLTSAATHGIDVYLLTGEPGWGLDAAGESMIREIVRAQVINQSVSESAQLKGVIMDVEPYLTDQWDADPQKVMENFAAGLVCAHDQALECQLQFIVCVPYSYDTKGYADALETIVADGCDSVAVMNYYKGKEQEHIASEVSLARKYGKRLINIYELQPPEGDAVTEANTYYHDGLRAVYRNAVMLGFAYRGDIEFAIHDYDTWKEMIENE